MADNLVVLLNAMLDQPGNTTINEQHLSQKVVFASARHGELNLFLGSGTVQWVGWDLLRGLL